MAGSREAPGVRALQLLPALSEAQDTEPITALPTLSMGSPTTASLFSDFSASNGCLSDELVTSGSSAVICVLDVLLCVACQLSSSEPGSYDLAKPRPAQVITASEKQEEREFWSLRSAHQTRQGIKLLHLSPLLR